MYSMYTSNLLSELEYCACGISIGPIFVGAPTYADDMAIIANTPWKLQAFWKTISEYAFKRRYSFNLTVSDSDIHVKWPYTYMYHIF